MLPYDAELIRMLAGQGVPVDFYASRTRYNGELLGSLAATEGVRLHLADVSGSVAPRWRGALAYLGLLLRLAARGRRYAVINLQFSAAWPLELPFLLIWRRRLVFTVHNPVPHGFTGLRHRPTGWIATWAGELVFVSEFSRGDFLRRYGEARFAAKARVVPHGLLPLAGSGASGTAGASTTTAGSRAATAAAEASKTGSAGAGASMGMVDAPSAPWAPLAPVAVGAPAAATQTQTQPQAPQRAPVPYRPTIAAPTALIFWGNVQPYKGVELFAALARSAEVRRRGLRLEVHGAWSSPSSPEMARLRQELIGLGVAVHDRFLGAAEVRALLAREALFLLPYRAASQSGALYSLLHAGRMFACSDIGDLGAFMRRFGLDDLLLQGRTAEAVLACLSRLQAAPERLAAAFSAAQQASRWEAIWPAAAAVYCPPGPPDPDATIAPRRP